MSEEIKSLIEKIKTEGIQKATEQAQEIERAARLKADRLIADAQKSASAIIAEAKQSAEQTQRSTQHTLAQAGRDFCLLVKKEVAGMLDTLIRQKVQEALTPEDMVKLIEAAINASGINHASVVVSNSDAQKIEKLISALGEKLKKGITLTASNEIRNGFVISFDQGKSQFDFSEASLAEFISSSLKPKLSSIFEVSAERFESR